MKGNATPDGPNRLFVLTGGPGSGKSTLIRALEQAGHACAEEAGRGVIRDQTAIGGSALPWIDPSAFAEQMLGWDMRSHRNARGHPGAVFFDRGVPDTVGYLRLHGLPVPPHLERAVDLFRYEKRVFIAPPWPEIYERDAERRQSPEEAERTHRSMVETYGDCGYELVELPRRPVPERVTFVLEQAGLR
ncbi:AAA family ATPase [Azospirillum agricola]|uniref:AAA family ATPase n=1 Tax=Azospirillum agricola TaxID=1720247 RepID=UPI000A0F0CFC|nr:AAA family ATPase [Azospirillum agricola]SMH44785.1 Predicted ATPase [Azospirillum lipoferum]